MKAKGLFFSLLRKSLWGRELDVQVDAVSSEELLAAIRMAKSQAVLCLVANELLGNEDLSCKLGDGVKMNLQRFVMSNFSTSQMLNNSLVKVVTELRKYGIDPVLLKGQGIAKYYPIPELRQCGDIDIYVGQEHFEKTCEVIGAMSTPEDHQGDIPSLKHFHTRIGKAFYEIHRYTDVYFPRQYDLKYQEISDAGMDSDLVPLDFAGVEVMTPSLDFNVFFIFNHFWHHFIADGVGLRQICDWARLLHVHYGRIDVGYLADVLAKMGLMKEWKVFGYIAVNSLGLPADEMPFYDTTYQKLAGGVLELIMREGNFGKENLKGHKRPKGYFAGKLYSFKSRFQRNFRVMKLFPKEAIRHISKVFFVGIAVVFNDKFAKYLED